MKELHYQSENECLIVDIVKNDLYGWDVDVRVFPTTALTGSYNDFEKLVNDIKPFVLMNLNEEERIDFANRLKELAYKRLKQEW